MTIRERIAEANEAAMLLDEGFDDAIVGVAERCGQPALVVYDALKVIDALVRDGMNEDEAAEWFSHNISGAWVGPHTPLFLWSLDSAALGFDL